MSRRPLPNGADGGGSASDDVLMEPSSTPTSKGTTSVATTNREGAGAEETASGCGRRGRQRANAARSGGLV